MQQLKDIAVPSNHFRQYQILLVLLLYAFFLLLTCSADGWLRFPTLRGDSAWFFMGGKSWMSGLTPYVNFTDSKGPLLWLIYGLGCLISPHDLHGVFLFQIFFYWLDFYVLYKAANLFLKNDALSIVASMIRVSYTFIPGCIRK